MPFTLSHPGLALPFNNSKFKLSVTGLVIGSMAPDLEYYLYLRLGPTLGNTILGFFIINIPFTIIIAFLFHNILRNTFIVNLPGFLKSRFITFYDFNWNCYVLHNKIRFMASVIIGILSHLFWDAFTHYDGTFVLLWPPLNQYFDIYGEKIYIYKILQVVLSIAGLLVIYIYFTRLPVKKDTLLYKKPEITYWFLITSITLVIFLVRLYVIPYFITFWDFFVTVVGSFFYSSIIVSIYYIKFRQI